MHIVGRINRDIYRCITNDIMTDEVIITDERILHIKERHPNDYERFCGYIPEIIDEVSLHFFAVCREILLAREEQTEKRLICGEERVKKNSRYYRVILNRTARGMVWNPPPSFLLYKIFIMG